MQMVAAPEGIQPLQGLGAPLIWRSAVLHMPVDDTACHQLAEWPLSEQIRIGSQLRKANQTAVTLCRIPIAAHHVLEGGNRQGVQQGGIMGGHQDPHPAVGGNPLDVLKQHPRAARVNPVVDFFHDPQRTSLCRKQGCRDREDP